MIVIYYIMQNSFEWPNWMIVNLLVGTVQLRFNVYTYIRKSEIHISFCVLGGGNVNCIRKDSTLSLYYTSSSTSFSIMSSIASLPYLP